MKHPKAKTDNGFEISIPDGKVEVYPNGKCSHYLWIGGNECWDTVSKRAELRKLRKLIDTILTGNKRAYEAQRTKKGDE